MIICINFKFIWN